MSKVVAIMPIKLKNERLPGKNVMLLGDKPLLCHELDTLKMVNGIDDIYVYCSSNEVEKYLPEGVIFKQRSEKLDLPSSNFSQIFEAFSKEVDAEIYIYAHATAPFISKETMQECLDSVLSGKNDSAFCAVKIQDYLWKNGEPLNFDATNVPRSQDLDVIYRETSGVYVYKKEVFKKYHRRIGMSPFIKEVSYKEAIDINNPEDFILAERMVDISLEE